MEGLVWIGILILVICIVKSNKPYNEEELSGQQHATTNNMICPHCQTKGSITTQKVKKKVGISGGKATAAIMTCGLSMFATGLSRKDIITEATCSNCGQTWYY